MPSLDPWIGPRGSSIDRLLQVLRERGPMTRPEVARLTGMSVGGVRPIVAALIERGDVVQEADRTPAGPGRPGVVLRAVVPDGLVLGLDFGHAHVAVALGDLDGTLLDFDRRDADVDRDAASALRIAATLSRAVLRKRRLADVQRVVVGVPGPVDRSGALRSTTIAADWAALDIPAAVAERLHVADTAVDVENDAHLGALGEVRAGAASGCSDVVYVKASHGLGAGLVLDGALYRGASGLTGEIGHAIVDPDGVLCRCGSRGCLETLVSVERVRAQVRYVLGSTPVDGEPLAAAAAHPAARRIVLDAGRALGRALADVCNVLNPQRIVLGGELAVAGQPLVDGVAESIARYAQPAVADTSVVLSALGERAQAVGALAVAARRACQAAWTR